MLLHQLFLYLNIYPKKAHSRPQEVPPFCEEMGSTFPPDVPKPCLVLSCQFKHKEYCYLNTCPPEEHCRLLTGEMALGRQERSLLLSLSISFPRVWPCLYNK